LIIDISKLQKIIIKCNNKLRVVALDTPTQLKKFIVCSFDNILVAVSLFIAFGVLEEISDLCCSLENSSILLPLLVAWLIINPIFFYFGLYKIIFRYSDWSAFLQIMKACFTYGAIYFLIFWMFSNNSPQPSTAILHVVILSFLLSYSRYLARLWFRDAYVNRNFYTEYPSVIVFGTGYESQKLASFISSYSNSSVIGYVDMNLKFKDRKIGNLSVFLPEDIKSFVFDLRPNKLLLALPSSEKHTLEKILKMSEFSGVVKRHFPDRSNVLTEISSLNNIDFLSEEDILPRDLVLPIPDLLKRDIQNKTVLVTGAGGSIGKELCHQIIQQNPEVLILLDHSEFALFEMGQQIKLYKENINSNVYAKSYLGSVCDENLLERIFANHTPDTVYHAAAYKHIDILEKNPAVGFTNNASGTRSLAEKSIKYQTNKFVLVSTDKAVNPSSMLGYSKRFAEMILQALSSEQKRTSFSIVRFGNVLESSGSVIPFFREQIKKGGPVTVTHRNVTRYFMTISEAASLVIQAGSLSGLQVNPSNKSLIYILSMGKRVKIYEIAKRMIQLSGLELYDKKTGEGTIKIEFTGLRPGEKLHEELLSGFPFQKTPHPKIYSVNDKFLAWPRLKKEIEYIEKNLKNGNIATAVEKIRQIASGLGT
jgi:FlaA1/EpsC-like NDP-sugar epimerase